MEELIDCFKKGVKDNQDLAEELQPEIERADKIILSMDRILAVKGIPIPKTNLREA